ncbi:MAG: ABC transporter substrate-binding protein [Armatimonadetes bacterium]|nr:ABC transporter substrate-binding protein [Armatimonadota bacterium]
MRSVRRAWLAAWGLTLLAGCRNAGSPAGPASAPQPSPAPAGAALTIGAIFPLSTGAGRIGEMKRQGADLAIEHLNAAGGISGRPLSIVYVDSKNSTTEALNGLQKLVSVDGVPVVMAAMSQVCLALIAPAERAGVVLYANASHPALVVLYANASHPALTGKSPWVFRNLPDTGLGSSTMAQYAAKTLGLKRVAVLSINDEYGAEAVRVFTAAFGKQGGQVTGTDTFDRTDTDLRAQLTKLAAATPDGWWIPGYGSALGLVLKQKEELKLGGTVLCDLGLVDQNVLKSAGPGAEKAYVVAPAFDPAAPGETVQRFVRDFEARYHETPPFDAPPPSGRPTPSRRPSARRWPPRTTSRASAGRPPSTRTARRR